MHQIDRALGELPPGIVFGCSDSGQSFFVYFANYEAQQGRFELFSSLREIADFLRQCHVVCSLAAS